MSTLKYAERAKRIKNKAVVNENPTDKMIRELKEENDRLKAMLQSGGVSIGAGGAAADPEARRLVDEQMRQLQAQIDSNQRMSDAMARSWEQVRRHDQEMRSNHCLLPVLIELQSLFIFIAQAAPCFFIAYRRDACRSSRTRSRTRN
jgi:hypothetical protein